jgi:hypothetical protein
MGAQDIDKLYAPAFLNFINIGLKMAFSGRNQLPTFEMMKIKK